VITRVEFENYRCLERVALHLTPVTVLVGPMGSGKSTVLDGIHMPATAVINSSHVVTRRREIDPEVDEDGRAVHVRAHLSDSPADALECIWHDGGRAVRAHGEGMERVVWEENDRWIRAVERAPLRFDASRLAEPVASYGPDRLQSDGLALAKVFGRISDEDPFLLALLNSRFESVLPGWRGPLVVPEGSGRTLAMVHERFGKVPARELSAGVLRLVAHSLLEFLPLPPVVMVDDPDVGVDEEALPLLAQSLAAIAREPGLDGAGGRQVVVATRSGRLAEELRRGGASLVATRMTAEGVRFEHERQGPVATEVRP